MRGDNIERVPEWVYRVDSPPVTDDEPWRWTCGTCGQSMPRDRVAGHVAAEDREAPSGAAFAWAVALLLLAVIVAVAAWRLGRG